MLTMKREMPTVKTPEVDGSRDDAGIEVRTRERSIQNIILLSYILLLFSRPIHALFLIYITTHWRKTSKRASYSMFRWTTKHTIQLDLRMLLFPASIAPSPRPILHAGRQGGRALDNHSERCIGGPARSG